MTARNRICEEKVDLSGEMMLLAAAAALMAAQRFELVSACGRGRRCVVDGGGCEPGVCFFSPPLNIIDL